MVSTADHSEILLFKFEQGRTQEFFRGEEGRAYIYFFQGEGSASFWGLKTPSGLDGKMMRLAFPPSLFWLLLFCCSTRDEDPDWFGDLNTRAKTKENKFFILFLFLAFYVSFFSIWYPRFRINWKRLKFIISKVYLFISNAERSKGWKILSTLHISSAFFQINRIFFYSKIYYKSC